MGKGNKKHTAAHSSNIITGLFCTNSITDNKTTKKGNVKNAHNANAVYERETSEIIQL